MANEESTPIPDSGVTPDNVMGLIDGVADLIVDDELPPLDPAKAPEPQAQSGEPGDEPAGETGEEPTGDEPTGEEQGEEQQAAGEEGPGDGEEPAPGTWQDFELDSEGNQQATVPFQLKVEEDGTRAYRFKAAEETIEVGEAEMIAGYQRMQDYSRSKNELVQKEDELLPYANVVAYLKTDPQFVQHIQSYFQNGAAPVQDDLSITDDQIRAAMENDADEANRLLTARETARQRAQVTRQATEQQQNQLLAWAARQQEVARSKFPDYDDVQGELRDFLISEGFSEQEIANAYDARMFSLAYKAHKYDLGEANRRAPRKELKDKRRKPTPPKIIKSGTGKQQSKVTPADQQRIKRQKGLFDKAMATGDSDDWTSAIETMLPDDAI